MYSVSAPQRDRGSGAATSCIKKAPRVCCQRPQQKHRVRGGDGAARRVFQRLLVYSEESSCIPPAPSTESECQGRRQSSALCILKGPRVFRRDLVYCVSTSHNDRGSGAAATEQCVVYSEGFSYIPPTPPTEKKRFMYSEGSLYIPKGPRVFRQRP